MSLQDEHDIATKHPDVKEAYIKLTDAITGARTSMTAQGKPDRCPTCGSTNPVLLNRGCRVSMHKWHSSPVPAAAPQPSKATPWEPADYYGYETRLSEEGYREVRKVGAPQAESVPIEPHKLCGSYHGTDRPCPTRKESESVPSGEDAAREFRLENERQVLGYIVGYVSNAECDRLMTLYAASQSERVAELERSNSLLRERITAAEGVLKKCDDIAMDERVPNHKALEEIVRQIDAYFEKDKQ